MSNRRAFLRMLAGVPIGAALEWDPLARTIFLPPKGGWPSGQLAFGKLAFAKSDDDVLWAPMYDWEPGTEAEKGIGFFVNDSWRTNG